MRSTFDKNVEKGRVRDGQFATAPGTPYGAFFLLSPMSAVTLKVIVSDEIAWKADGMPGEPWDHVSVSTQARVPNWAEMCWIKSLFFDDEETVVQYHPAKSEYVNVHPFVLHLWRKCGEPFPMPPVECV